MTALALLTRLAVRIRRRIKKLKRENEELRREVAALKEEAAVRESFISDIMEQKLCPDCQRKRGDWY